MGKNGQKMPLLLYLRPYMCYNIIPKAESAFGFYEGFCKAFAPNKGYNMHNYCGVRLFHDVGVRARRGRAAVVSEGVFPQFCGAFCGGGHNAAQKNKLYSAKGKHRAAYRARTFRNGGNTGQFLCH